MKQKALVFYTYLPPWRIDVFNEMGKYYDLTIVFLNADSEGFTYNREVLTKQLEVDYLFWDKGFKIGSRAFRLGILGLLKKYQPSVVFSHEYSPTSILLALFHRLKRYQFKYIITTSDNLSIAEGVKGIKRNARDFVLSNADGIIVYSQAVKEWYEKTFKGLRVEVCPNIQSAETLLKNKKLFPKITTDYLERYQLKSGKIILFIGRLAEEKGLDLLIKAFAQSNRKDYKLVIVGEGKEKQGLIDLTSKLQVDDAVCFPGYFEGASLYAWYAIANFFILPSRYEPFGAVVNEALVFGCPVVASQYIGALDFIEKDSNGLIFDPLKEEEFIETLNRSFQMFDGVDPKRKDLMITSFKEHVRSFEYIIDNES